MIQRADWYLGSGVVNGADGVVVSGCIFTTPARTAAGVYTLTRAAGDGFDAAETVIMLTPLIIDISIFYVHTSDTVKTVTARTSVPDAGAGANIDSTFSFLFMKTGNTN